MLVHHYITVRLHGKGNGYNGIYLWDGEDNVQISEFGSSPSLYEGQIAFVNSNELYFWDGTSSMLISDSLLIQWGDPSLYNNEIAFEAHDGK